jgi:exosortase
MSESHEMTVRNPQVGDSDTTVGKGRTSVLWTASLALVCILPLVVMSDLTRALYALILTDGTYSHLPLIPLLSAFLIYTERQSIFRKVSHDWRPGSAVMAAGVASLLMAQVNLWQWSLANRLSLMAFGLVVLWIGLFIQRFGIHASRAAQFPLLFLLFAVPIPEWVLSRTIFLLQAGSADASEAFFRLIGMPYLRRGFDFTLPAFTIRVAEECSGIRSTLALVLSAVLAGHFFLKSNLRILLLCVLVIPISILKNGFRIVALSYLAANVDPGYLTGRLHHRGGVVFFTLGLLMAGIALVVLRRFERRSWNRGPNFGIPLGSS